jgi:hypothetical protein
LRQSFNDQSAQVSFKSWADYKLASSSISGGMFCSPTYRGTARQIVIRTVTVGSIMNSILPLYAASIDQLLLEINIKTTVASFNSAKLSPISLPQATVFKPRIINRSSNHTSADTSTKCFSYGNRETLPFLSQLSMTLRSVIVLVSR